MSAECEYQPLVEQLTEALRETEDWIEFAISDALNNGMDIRAAEGEATLAKVKAALKLAQEKLPAKQSMSSDCEGCAGLGVRVCIMHNAIPTIERCDTCETFGSDAEAAWFVQSELVFAESMRKLVENRHRVLSIPPK